MLRRGVTRTVPPRDWRSNEATSTGPNRSLWRASDGATGVEFMVGDLETVVSAAAGVIRRAEAIDAITR